MNQNLKVGLAEEQTGETQEQIFKQRFGVEISRKTTGGWMHLMANWLSLIYEMLRNEICVSGYIQADAEA